MPSSHSKINPTRRTGPELGIIHLEEARALEGLAQAHLLKGDPGQAAAHLRLALAIYQRIGAPDARRVQETLTQLRQDNLARSRKLQTRTHAQRCRSQ
jgi:hypothetical protein